MGLVYAFNELLSCIMTGLFTALCMWGLAKLGLFPVIFVMPAPEEDEEEE